MTQRVNRQVVLVNRPTGIPQAEDFDLISSEVPTTKDGHVLLRNIYLSVEPAMRGWVCDVGNYSEPVAIGGVMRSLAVAIVVESGVDEYKAGEYVVGMFGWQDYALVEPEVIDRHVPEEEGLPVSTALGVLGINGLAAYFGLLEVGLPKKGETVLVSTAAGAVGSCVGQIAALMGCRVVGITGGQAKCDLCIDEFGFDAAVDYKADNFEEQLAAALPDGIDVYFDNTSGNISDAAMGYLNSRARVVICGTASISNWNPLPLGPRVERHLLVKRARMEGFVIFDYAPRYHEGIAELSKWIRAGELRYREEVVEGIEHAPDAIAALYRGENLGKRLIKIS
jgi:NADPH-dependent curcumin reductase CurA